MAIYVATFTAVAVTAAQDVFEIVAPSTGRVRIRELRLGQYSDAADAQAEMLSILALRGYTVSGSGGSSVTPANMQSVGLSTPLVAASTVEANNTTVANTGTPLTLLADAFNVMGGFRYYPIPEERLEIAASERLVFRITAPADSLTMNGTLVFEEIGL